MRRRVLASLGHKLTAKDYVQNGLIAMWDGIENAGFAAEGYQHDPNATVWKDLVGQRDMRCVGTANWKPDAYDFYNASHFETDSSDVGIVTCELVFPSDIPVVRNQNFVIDFGDGSDAIVGLSSANHDWVCTSSNAGFNMTFVTFQFRSMAINYESRKVMIDSDVITTSGRTNYTVNSLGRWTIGIRSNLASTTQFSGVINCIRLYARSLTEAEIDANYKIDKSRFNLLDVA